MHNTSLELNSIKKTTFLIFFFLLFSQTLWAKNVVSPLPNLIGSRNIFQPMINAKLISTFVAIHYANVGEVAKFIQDKSLNILSTEGHVYADNRTNALWIQDYPKNIQKIKTLINHLDIPVKQILIKARIVNVDENYTKSLGVLFATQQQKQDAKDQSTVTLPLSSFRLANTLIPIIKFKNNTLLNLELDALEKEGHAKLISSPELMASNRQSAFIESGEEVPFQEQTANGGTSITFKKAVLRLKVTPEIMPHHKILLHLTVNQDKVSSLTIQGAPAIRTQQIKTQVLVKNLQTFVLGGIFEETNSKALEGIPFLQKIPLLGVLFRKHSNLQKRQELLIFVTPQIINS